MGWPIPKFEELPVSKGPSVWLLGVASIGLILVTTSIVFFSWPKHHEHSGDMEFWLCLLGVPSTISSAFLCAVWHRASMTAFGTSCFKYYASAVLLVWQRWTRQYVVLSGFSILLVEEAMAEKIAGLSGTAPQNKTDVRRLEGIVDDFRSNRAERITERLLRELKDTLVSSSIEGTLRIVAWAGSAIDAELTEITLRKQWDRLDLSIRASVEVVSEISWQTIERSVIDERSHVLLLCIQLHDDGGYLAQFTESAVAHLFQPSLPRLDSGVPVVRIYRAMPVSTASMCADFQQLGESGAIPLADIRSGWHCNLGKAEGYALSRAVGDSGLVLEGGTSGMVSVCDCIGPVGPINPWVSLALAAELVQYGQGAQLLACQEGRQAFLLVASANEATSPRRMDPPPPSASHASVVLVSICPIFAVLLGVFFKAPDFFPWLAAGVAGAVMCALALRLFHPGMVRIRTVSEIEAQGGRLPPMYGGREYDCRAY
ncbi:hypothetical protein [Caballeronia sp. GAWG1-5s-s]|uniref:hypothetical protein n=1 Tax=Caballeronia sp. GAWG1-5s-s TaxID=2921743 RepID=UPI002027C429|nr:hypothetical protein [Caballeronia sp. GAWG1-5s-s]